jgi:hypothetical protein
VLYQFAENNHFRGREQRHSLGNGSAHRIKVAARFWHGHLNARNHHAAIGALPVVRGRIVQLVNFPFGMSAFELHKTENIIGSKTVSSA